MQVNRVFLPLLLMALPAIADDTVIVHVRADGAVRALDALPDRIEEGDGVWTWSAQCVPQRVTAAAVTCAAGKESRIRIIAPRGSNVEGVEIRWGTEALLRELPDALLPMARVDAAGTASIHVPDGQRVFARVAGPSLASAWQAVRAPVTRIGAAEAAAMTWRVADGEGERAEGARVEIRTVDAAQPASLVFRGLGDRMVVIPPIRADAFIRATIWSDGGAPVTVSGRARDVSRTVRLGRGHVVRGTAVDEEERIVAGAVASALFLAGQDVVTIRKMTRTDASGRFELPGIPDGNVEWSVTKAPFARTSQIVRMTADRDAGQVTLRRARELAVDVRNARGEPVQKASVSLLDGTTVETNDRGMAVLRSVPADVFALRVRAAGHLRHETTVSAAAKQPLRVLLEPAARVRGRVVAAAGDRPAGPGTVAVDVDRRTFIAEFGEDGVFEIDAGEGGMVSLEIRPAALAPFRAPEREVARGELVDLGTIEVSDGLSISGRAVDAVSAAPKAGVAVHVLRPSDFGPLLSYARRDFVTGESQADGTFRISGLAPGVYSLWSEGEGSAPAVMTGLTLASDLPNGELSLGDVPIHAGRALEVSCTPIPRCGTQVSVAIAGADWLPVGGAMSEGRAVVAPVPPGPVLVRISDRAGTIQERTVTIAADEPVTEIAVRLPSVTVRGTVTRGGRRATGGKVAFDPPSGQNARFVQLAHVRGSGTLANTFVGAMTRSLTAPVSEDGSFVLSDLAPGDYRVTWTSDGVSSAPRQVSIAEAAEVPLRIDLPAARVEGKVLTSEGTLPPRTVVSVECGGARADMVAAADGTFVFDGLPAGQAIVRARAVDRRQAEGSVELREDRSEHLELTLAAPLDETLMVNVRASGLGVPNAQVFVRQRGVLRSATTASGGTAHLTGVVASEPVEIAVHAPPNGWAFVQTRQRSPVTIDVAPASGGLSLQTEKEGGYVALFAATGFPIHEALAMLGIRPAVRAGAPLSIHRLPPGTYTAAVAGVQRQVSIAREPRVIDF